MLSFIENYQIPLNNFDVIIPIPLSGARYRERSYNQSELLAQILAEQLSLPLCHDSLIKIRHTAYHAHLTEKERWTNIRGAFKIKHPRRCSKRSILLVDDLLTTGATASEAALALKEHGAKSVGVMALAITPSL